jgi:phosphoglycolate phosphatase
VLKPPATLLFDWDNTLVDAWAGVQHALNTARAAYGLPPWDRATLLASVRLSLRDSFPQMFGPDWECARAIFSDTYARDHLAHLIPMPGAAEAIVAHPIVGVVSNKQGRFLRVEARALGWAPRLACLVGAGDAARDKPLPDQLLVALGAMRIPPSSDIWYVGDTGTDMQAARAAGLTAVLVGDAAHDGGVAALAPDLHFPDCRAIAAALAG